MRNPQPDRKTARILQGLQIWRVLYSLLAAGGALSPWVGWLPNLRVWQGILLSVVLGLASIFSLLAVRDIQQRKHRGRVISLTLDYLTAIAFSTGILQIGQVFIGIDSLADAFGGSVPFLLLAFAGYLLTTAAPKITKRARAAKTLTKIGGDTLSGRCARHPGGNRFSGPVDFPHRVGSRCRGTTFWPGTMGNVA